MMNTVVVHQRARLGDSVVGRQRDQIRAHDGFNAEHVTRPFSLPLFQFQSSR
jgi:hypothetical protein